MCFLQHSEAAFSYRYTTQAARNLTLSYTTTVRQTPNTCMATLAVSSNESSNKTRSSPVLFSLLRNISSNHFWEGVLNQETVSVPVAKESSVYICCKLQWGCHAARESSLRDG